MRRSLPIGPLAALTLALLLLLPGAASATPLTLETVLRSVDAHAPLLASERATRDAAEAEARAARGEFDPVLTAQVRVAPLGYYDPRRVEVLLEQPTPLLGTSLYAGYRLGRGKIPPYYGELRTLDRGELRGGVRVPLLAGRAIDPRRAALRSGRADADAVAAEVRALLLQLEQRAAKAYFGWVAAGHKARIAAALVSLAEQRRAQLDGLVDEGALPAIDARDNERTVVDRQRQRVVLQRALQSAALELSLYLRSADGSPRVPDDGELPALDDLSVDDPPVAAALAEGRALAARPELEASAAREARAEVDLALAANRVAPRLDVFGEVSRDYGAEPAGQGGVWSEPAAEVGAQLSLPLGLRSARGKRAAAEAKVRAAREKTRYVADQVRNEVRDAHSQRTAAAERAALARTGLALAREVAIGERERFTLGASSLLLVNLREQQAADAEHALVDALAEVRFAAVRVRTAAGDSASRAPEAGATPAPASGR